jgi:hypothetical protein
MWPASVVPPTGYWFNEAGIRVEANDLAGLVAALTQFRKDSNAPAGDPEFEIHLQLCTRHPSLSTELKDKKLAKAAVLSLRKFVVRRLPGAADAEVRRRAEICHTCPMRRLWSQHCGPCNTSAQSVLKYFKGREKAYDGQACALDGMELSVGLIYNSKERLKVAPAVCWRRA